MSLFIQQHQLLLDQDDHNRISSTYCKMSHDRATGQENDSARSSIIIPAYFLVLVFSSRFPDVLLVVFQEG